MVRNNIKKYLDLFLKKHIGLLACMVNTFGNEKYISLNSQQCMTQPTLINLHRNEYIHCNTINDTLVRICISNKTEDVNLSIFNMLKE